MNTYINPPRSEWPALLLRPTLEANKLGNTVAEILNEVKTKGDEALLALAAKFDKAAIRILKVSDAEFKEAEEETPEELKKAIQLAAANIHTFHASQVQAVEEIETSPGVVCWRKSIGIEKVGLYIPSGTAPLFSTVLMLAIPAKIAGCKEIILCSPPDKDGKIHPAVLYAARITGVTQVFKAGGAQAIGAMAYGTQSIPKTFKIFGPGNQFVTAAKQMVNLEGTAIDMPAGPSEVLVLADEGANAEFIAADLLAQAEHGTDSQTLLVTNSENLAEEVENAINAQMASLPRKNIAAAAIANSKILVMTDKADAIDIVNEYAPEHLIIDSPDEAYYLENLRNAGSVFLGKYTPESAGDYASGTNHTLPTNGYAKAYSGVSLDSFVKKITFQKITKDGLKALAPTIETMAAAEGLDAHKRAVSIRFR